MALAAPALAAEEPGVFKVPGTDSTIKFYGYIQLDTTLDLEARVGDIENNDWATFLPGVPHDETLEAKNKKPQLYMTARTSRFGLQTNTPTDMGALTVRLEGDFNGPNGFQTETYTNSVLFRLRHAYGQLGGFLAGQTWTTFLDLGAYPDVVDFNGPGTTALVRNPMLRYTLGLGQGLSLAIAAENTRGAQFGGAKFQTIPDFHANLTYGAKWGHVSLRGVTQQFNYFQSTDVSAKTAFGVAGAASGSVKIGGDTLVAQFAGGPGIGRYLLNAAGATFNLPGTDPAAIGGNPGAFRVETNGDLDLITVYGYHLGYTHVWRSGLRSNLIWAQTFIEDPKTNGLEATNEMEKEMMQAFVNTFWSFTKNAEVGLEYVYGEWKSFTGGNTPELKGVMSRVNMTFHYNFW